MRRAMLVLCILVLLPLPAAQGGDDGDWRSREVDPNSWEDGPILEDNNPMNNNTSGNPLMQINVSYVPGHGQSRVEGEIIIELFEQWAPISVENMIEHIEIDLYDDTFFHRVIDDFVTQAGDPTCRTVGVYPGTTLTCGSGGTGETIPLEINENLSHVDGAIGMARGNDEDSADSQWFIDETEAHSLDGNYAVFGIVRDGMTHVRAIALTPTSDDPTGSSIQNPASSAGRPLYEASIIEVSMLGVVAYPEEPPVEEEEEPPMVEESVLQSLVNVMQSEAGMGVGILVLLLIILLMFLAKVEPPLTLKQEAVTAELIE